MIHNVTNTKFHLLTPHTTKIESTAADVEKKPSTSHRQDQIVIYPDDQAGAKDIVELVVQSLNEFISPINTHLKFEFHEELKEYYVTIIDTLSNEVIKEIPPKKVLDMYAAMAEYLGLLVDRKI